MQNARLSDQLLAKEQDSQRVQQDLQATRLELEHQLTLLAELEGKFARQAEESAREVAALTQQLADAMQRRSTIARPPDAGATLTSHELTTHTHVALDNEVQELETQLVKAEASIRELAAEKLQLLEVQELTEEDVGRRVDEAVAQQQARTTELSLQVEVRTRCACACCC